MSKRKYILGQPHLLRRRGKNKFWTGWVDGKEVSLGTADRNDAQRRLDGLGTGRRAEQVPAERGGAEGDAPAVDSPLLTEVALLYATHCRPPRHTKKTADDYANRIVAFVEVMEEKKITRMDQVTFKVMSAYVDWRGRAGRRRGKDQGKGVGARTVNRDLAPVRGMFAFAKREGLIATNPFKGEDFAALKLREPRPKPNAMALSPERVDIFMAKAEEVVKPAYVVLFQLTAGSAIRFDEARHFDKSDIEQKREKGDRSKTFYMLTITPKRDWTSKGYRYRDIPISAKTAEVALAFLEMRDRTVLDDKTVWMMMRKVQKAAGLPNFSMHDLRRAWASAMHANGASLKQVSVWLGHSSVEVTERYIRVFQTDATGHKFLSR